MSSEITSAGSVGGAPARPEGPAELTSILSLAFTATYAQMDAGSFSFLGTLPSPFVLNPGGITKVRALVIRCLDAQSIQVLVSSALGTDQKVPCSGLFFMHCPKAGDELTAVKLVGSGRIEYLAAGDAS